MFFLSNIPSKSSLLQLCLPVCLSACRVHICTCTSVWMWRSKVGAECLFSNGSLPCFCFETVFHWTQSALFSRAVRKLSSKDLPVPTSPIRELQRHASATSFYVNIGDSHSPLQGKHFTNGTISPPFWFCSMIHANGFSELEESI